MKENNPDGIGIIGSGKCLAQEKITSAHLAKQLNVTSDWIIKASGIKTRYYVGEAETASSLAVAAAKQAIQRAKISARDIGLIVCCTFSSDDLFPAMAYKLQHQLGLERAWGFDLSAGSTGFQIGIKLASDHLRFNSNIKHALVLAVTVQSPFLNPKNPNTSIMFGDGSGAVIVSRVPKRYGLLASDFFAKGDAYDALRLNRHMQNSQKPYIEMDGKQVSREFLKFQPITIQRALKSAEISKDEVDLFIFHQANLRLIHFLTHRANIAPKKVFSNIEHVGNTSDASIAIALNDALEQKLIKNGSIVVLSGVGPGTIFGASVFRWYSK